MTTNMIECPICNFHYHENRNHCPTCGTQGPSLLTKLLSEKWVTSTISNPFTEIVVAHGAERARQLPQSPRVFQLVD